jgi:hypothetical protein
VQVLRQHADRDRFKRVTLLNRPIRMPKAVDVSDESIARPVRECHGEEKEPTFDLRTKISRHGGMLS